MLAEARRSREDQHQHEAPSDRRSGTVDRREAISVATLLVLVGTLGANLASRSYFFQDDFIFIRISRDMGLGWDYLTRSAFGHFIPGFHAANWALDRGFGLSWHAATVFLVGMLCLATLLVQRLARALGADLLASLAIAAVFGLSPVSAPSLAWWAAGVSLLTTTAFSVAAFLAFVRWERSRSWGWLAAVSATTTIAILFWEKSLLLPVWLAIFAVVVLDAGVPWRERARGFIERWACWVAVGVPTLALGSYYVTHGYMDEAGETAGLSTMAGFVGRGLTLGLVPNLLGLEPTESAAGRMLRVAVLAGAAIWLSWRHRGAGAVWVFAASCLVLNLLVLARGRALQFPTSAEGARYHLDNLVIAVVSIAAITGLPRRTSDVAPTAPRVGARGWAALSAFVLVFAAVSWPARTSLAGDQLGSVARSYIATFRQSLGDAESRHGRHPFLDLVVPGWLVAPVFEPYGRYESVLTLLDNSVHVEPVDRGFVLDEAGSVRLGRIARAEALVSPIECADLQAPVRVRRVDGRSDEAILRLELQPPSTASTLRIVWYVRDEIRGLNEVAFAPAAPGESESVVALSGPPLGWDSADVQELGGEPSCLEAATLGAVEYEG